MLVSSTLRSRIRSIIPQYQEKILYGLLSIVITGSVLTLPLDFIEAPLYDLRQALSKKPAVDDRIVLLTIDDQTLSQMNETSPLPVRYHNEALQKLQNHEVKAVGYVVDFNKVERIDEKAFQGEEIQGLYRTMVKLNAQHTPLVLGIPFDLNGEVIPPSPLSRIPQAVALVHRDGIIFGKDKVTRRALVSLYDRNAFELSLANRAYPSETFRGPPGTYQEQDANTKYFLIRYHQQNGMIYDPTYESFPYPRYSFVDLVEDRIPVGVLKDKIILVGTFQRENPNDFTLISSEFEKTLVPKLLVQANILDSILNQQSLRPVPKTLLGLICLLLTYAIIVVSFKQRPSRMILTTLALLSGTAVFSWIFFQPIPWIGSFWLPLGSPMLAMTLAFYLLIPLRLYYEHRKRDKLEQEKTVMLQVEELKTNFLQLVTHDLKTPVAKIQGLTEQMKRNSGKNLTHKDFETLNQILLANEDLNHFISSLLELTRLDNQGIRVRLQSRDLNSVVETVITKHRFQAQAKSITILTHFEPLFPIKLDQDLISKVLSNLLDNAIKYSPEHTQITIETQETDQEVVLTLRDQGVGISESDQKQLFSRFFRGRNDFTQKNKGTGLGLYLSKYFIESHQGSIEVKSEPAVGTTFTIKIPIHLNESQIRNIGLTQSEENYA